MTFHAAARRQLHVLLAAGRRRHRMGAARQQVRRRRPGRQPRGPVNVSTDDVRDLAGEIEWAKASLISPEGYAAAVAQVGRDIPFDAAKIADGLRRIRDRSRPAATAWRCSTSTICCCTPRPRSRTTPRSRRSSATATAASSSTSTRTSPRCSSGCSTRGSASRDDLTVVGDANQTIYSFTGATPRLPAGLLAPVPRRRGGAARARLPVHPAGGVAGQPGDRRRARPDGRQQAAPGRPARPRARRRRSTNTPTRWPRRPRSPSRSSG